MNKALLFIVSCFIFSGCAYAPRLTTGQNYHSVQSLTAQMNYEQPKFYDDQDKFTGLRTIAWSKKYSSNQDFDKLFTIIQGGTKQKNLYAIALIEINPRHQYLKCNTVYWLADNEIIKPASLKYDSSINDAPVSVTETISSFFSASDYKKMAFAKKIEYRVCNKESFFVQDEIDGLRKVFESAGI